MQCLLALSACPSAPAALPYPPCLLFFFFFCCLSSFLAPVACVPGPWDPAKCPIALASSTSMMTMIPTFTNTTSIPVTSHGLVQSGSVALLERLKPFVIWKDRWPKEKSKTDMDGCSATTAQRALAHTNTSRHTPGPIVSSGCGENEANHAVPDELSHASCGQAKQRLPSYSPSPSQPRNGRTQR